MFSIKFDSWATLDATEEHFFPDAFYVVIVYYFLGEHIYETNRAHVSAAGGVSNAPANQLQLEQMHLLFSQKTNVNG